MNKEEVIKELKKHNRAWKEFERFMEGQTVGIGEDGKTDYYECDVFNFLQKPGNIKGTYRR